MKDTLFPRITHVKLEMLKNREKALKFGYVGTFSVCFGPGDDTAFCQIHLLENKSYRLPEVLIGGKEKRPVFKGKIRDELIERVDHARKMIKANYGNGDWGTTYWVAGSKVTIDKKEPAAAAAKS